MLTYFSRAFPHVNNYLRFRGYRAMVGHEARKKKNRKDTQYAWFMSTTVVPPDEVPTDDEFADCPGGQDFRGRRVVRRKLRGTADAEIVLSE